MRIATILSSLALVAAATAGVLAASPEPALAQPGGFGDVAEDAYYSLPVSSLAERGVFFGTHCEAGFCPGEPIRSQDDGGVGGARPRRQRPSPGLGVEV